MGKYLKYFEKMEGYNNFIGSDKFIKPNVSYVFENGEM